MATTQRIYFEFDVSLIGVAPRLWRRFLIRADACFHELHDTIQAACGWQDYHLYEFSTLPTDPYEWHGQQLAVSPYWEPYADEPEPAYAHRVRIRTVFRAPGDVCLYVYDFGDGWRHRLELVGVHRRPSSALRKILAGARAFPPEDCGAIPGYQECCAAMAIPEAEADAYDSESGEDMDPDWRELIERKIWMGNWDSERFDIKAVEQAFRRRVNWGEK